MVCDVETFRWCSGTLDPRLTRIFLLEDYMLCKAESRDPAHCLKEGRRVTRCAQDLCVVPLFYHLSQTPLTEQNPHGAPFPPANQYHEAARELSLGV